MKRIFLAVLGITMACSTQAQRQNQRMSSVYVTITGNKNLQVTIDGNVYSLSSNGTTSKLNTPITGLAAGTHSLAFTRANNNRKAGNMTTQFSLRKNYDMYINVTSNGALELIEKKQGIAVTGNTPMSTADFNMVMRDLRLQGPAQKITFLTTTFNRSNTYFTTTQVVQLLQQVRLESDRLPLAKLSFRTVTDPNNFGSIYSLFASQANKTDLEDYVNYYDEDLVVDADLSTAMSETNFNDLYRRIKNEYSINAQVNAITTAFGTAGNRFTASQASQLIQLINSEANRLSLAKLSYSTVVDPSNFSTVSNLLYTQSSRDELLAYINNGGVNSDTNIHTAMTETDFNILLQSVKNQFLPNAKMSYLTSTFNNATYYFTVSQAKTLIQLLSSESNRLQLSKAVYRNLVDRANYTQLYDLFTLASSRTALDAYVQAYRDQ